MAVPWIKLNTSIFDDEKIKLIDAMPEHDAILVIWIKLLTLAGKCNASGCLEISDSMPYTEEMLAAIFNRPLQIIRLALEAFERLGMIERHTKIVLVNWEKHQNEAALATIRAHDAERKRLQRNKLLECPGQVPDKSRNVHILDIELDKDKEVDIDIDINKSKNYNDEFLTFWESYPRKDNKKAASKAFATVMKTLSLTTILDRLAIYKRKIEVDKIQSQYIRMAATFLNNIDDYVAEPSHGILRNEPPKKELIPCPVCHNIPEQEKCDKCGFIVNSETVNDIELIEIYKKHIGVE